MQSLRDYIYPTVIYNCPYLNFCYKEFSSTFRLAQKFMFHTCLMGLIWQSREPIVPGSLLCASRTRFESPTHMSSLPCLAETKHHHQRNGEIQKPSSFDSLSLSLSLSLARSLARSLSVPIGHYSWQVLDTASGINTEQINVNFCWSAKTRVSIWKSL